MEQQRETPSPETEIHLRDYLRVVSARRWIVISVFFTVVLIVTVAVLVQTPIYRAKAQLLIEPAKFNPTEFKEVHDPTLTGLGGEMSRREFYETQYKLIVARPVLEKTFHQLGFGTTEEFRGAANPIDGFAGLFSVTPVRRSRLVSVTFEWRDPELAARVLDYLVNEYIAEYRRRSLGVTVGGLQALKEKADELRPKVEAKAEELQTFMVKHSMVSLERTQNIIVERLRELNKSLSEVEREKIQCESVHRTVQNAIGRNLPLEDMPEVAGSLSIRDLKLEYIRAKQDLADLSGRFGPNHPEVVAAKTKMRTVAQKIEEEVRSVLAATKAQYERSQRQMDEIRRELAEQEKRVLDFNRVAIGYNILKDAAETLRNAYEAITKRIEEIEISMAAGSKDDNIFIISRPEVPAKAAKPRKRRSVVLGALAGLALGLGLCFFVDYLDVTVKTREDVEKHLGVPVLGYVPAVRENELAGDNGRAASTLELLALTRPHSNVAEAFRSIRTSLAFSSPEGQLRKLLVTSSCPSEGKTLVSINVALAFAQAGKKTVLIDTDLRKSRVHRILGVSPSPGLTNLIAGEGPTSERSAIREVEGVENLSVLPCGPMPPNPAELLGSSVATELLVRLEQEFDMLVLDSPPVVNVTDSAVLSQYVQGAVLVVRTFSTQTDLARHATELLLQAQGKVLGVVLNNVDVPRGGYYGYDDYYYYANRYYYYGGGDGEDSMPRRTRRRRASARRKG